MNLKEFKNPGPMYRPAPFWSWNDKLDKEELKRQIREMAQKGWGSYFMHSRVGLVTGYLSDEWMELVRECAEEAKKTNTYAWLYDEDKWPSGFAGGVVPQDKANRDRALVLISDGNIREDDIVIKKISYEGKEYHICHRIAQMGDIKFNGTCYVDLMSKKTVRAFIDSTHEKYKEACGEYFGKEIPGMFTDEPCYVHPKEFKGVPLLPWSNDLPDFFRTLKGYSIEDYADELFFDTGDYQKIRFDFFDAATRLFVQNFTKQYYDWCDENNLKMTGHFMSEDNLRSQIEWIGAAMPHYEFMHWPGIDKLARHLKQLVTVKQLSSVVDQLHKERAFCEVFGCIGQHASFFHRKWIGDWQAALGISFVNHHLSLYSMRGERKRDYPPNFFYQQPWWDEERHFSDYMSRVSYTVTQGKRAVDILVIHPIASAWSVYSPIDNFKGNPSAVGMYDSAFTSLAESLTANRLDYHFGDEIIMESNARVENGKLMVGQHAYSTVVVPQSFTLRSNTLRLIKEFMEASADNKLIVIEPLPVRIDGMKLNIQWPDITEKAGSVREAVAMLDKIYPDRINIINSVNGENVTTVFCHERLTDEGRYILLASTEDKRELDTVITLKSDVMPVVLDLTTGETYGLKAERNGTKVKIRVKFNPAGSILLHIPVSPIDLKQAPAHLDSGVELGKIGSSICTITKCDTFIDEDNVLSLNDVTLYLDGKQVLDDKPVAMAWHNLFYKAPDGTPFKAVYKFRAYNIENKDMTAVIEMAENLDKITINGNEVKALKERGELGTFDSSKSWKDINFTRVPMDGYVKEGINELVIEGRKYNNITGIGHHIGVKDYKNHMATEVEAVYIVGDFIVVSENQTDFYIDGKKTVPCPVDITTSGYPFYAGKISFKYLLEVDDLNQVSRIRVNNVKAACVELYVNGKPAGLKYWEPYIFDVKGLLTKGSNEITVKASTTLYNLLGHNRIYNVDEVTYSRPSTFVDFGSFSEKYSLKPFGIEGITILG